MRSLALALAAQLVCTFHGAPTLAFAQTAAGGTPDGSTAVAGRTPPPHTPSDPVCLFSPAPSGPELERTVFTGAMLDGTTSVTFAGGVYSLRFDGDETIEYKIDVGDPAVAGGLLRVYEMSSDSFPVFEGGPAYRNASSSLKDATWLAQFATLVAHSHDATSVTLDYEDHVDGVHRRRHRFEIEGKSLRIRVWDLDGNTDVPANYSGLKIGRTASTDDPRLVRMLGTLATPIVHFELGNQHFYCANVLDLLWSNAADWTLPEGDSVVPGADSVDFSYSTTAKYVPMTNGKLAAPLDETFSIIVSTRVRDVLVTNTAPYSPYRDSLAYRTAVIFTGENTPWSAYDTQLDQFYSWGMRNLAVYFFSWWSSSDNGDATHYPAKDEAGYLALRNDPQMKSILVGEYTKYWMNWFDSPDFDVHELVLNGAGLPKGSNLAESARLSHATIECKKLKEHYGSNLGYQDVLTYASPSKGIGTDDIDQNAGSVWAKTMRDACIDRKVWLKAMQDILDGPILGEASIATQASNMEWLWTGYCDSVQRTINSGANQTAADLPFGTATPPTLWPVIPEYEWNVSAIKQTNHGNAFYSRFFSWADAGIFPTSTVPSYPLPEVAQDRYRAYEVTYGHGSFLQTNGPLDGLGDYLRSADILKEYYLMNGLQNLFFAAPVVSIRYLHNGLLVPFDQVLALSETTDSFLDPRIRIQLENGLVILVNHAPSPWMPDVPDAGFVIPEDGFYAYLADTGFVAFSGIPSGAAGRCDYASVPGEYEFFDGRGVVSGYGGVLTTNKRTRIRNFSYNRTVWENDLGGIEVEAGVLPPLQRIEVEVAHDVLHLGERTSFRVTGYDPHGGKRDLTLVTPVTSNHPNVATLTPGGAVMTHCVGQVLLTPAADPGVLAVPASLEILP